VGVGGLFGVLGLGFFFGCWFFCGVNWCGYGCCFVVLGLCWWWFLCWDLGLFFFCFFLMF